MSTFDQQLDDYKQKSQEATGDLAALYGDLLSSMEDGIGKAEKIATELSPAVRGIKELKQLLNIMRGGFIPIAQEIIQTATDNAAVAAAEDAGDLPADPE